MARVVANLNVGEPLLHELAGFHRFQADSAVRCGGGADHDVPIQPLPVSEGHRGRVRVAVGLGGDPFLVELEPVGGQVLVGNRICQWKEAEQAPAVLPTRVCVCCRACCVCLLGGDGDALEKGFGLLRLAREKKCYCSVAFLSPESPRGYRQSIVVYSLIHDVSCAGRKAFGVKYFYVCM